MTYYCTNFWSFFGPFPVHFSPLLVHFYSAFSPFPFHFRSIFSPFSVPFLSIFGPFPVYHRFISSVFDVFTNILKGFFTVFLQHVLNQQEYSFFGYRSSKNFFNPHNLLLSYRFLLHKSENKKWSFILQFCFVWFLLLCLKIARNASILYKFRLNYLLQMKLFYLRKIFWKMKFAKLNLKMWQDAKKGSKNGTSQWQKRVSNLMILGKDFAIITEFVAHSRWFLA